MKRLEWFEIALLSNKRNISVSDLTEVKDGKRLSRMEEKKSMR